MGNRLYTFAKNDHRIFIFFLGEEKYVCPSTFWCHCMPYISKGPIFSLYCLLFSSSQEVQHNCQLHRISFCADDKTDKRIFTFICKDSESNKHLCYVFDSDKCVRQQIIYHINVFEEIICHAYMLSYNLYIKCGSEDKWPNKTLLMMLLGK